MTWEQIDDPGAYVELGSGDPYRIPLEALVRGSSPVICKESIGASRFVKISPNPFVTLLKAREVCANHNIEPNV
ncbi:MAG TPA: hypothetical protein VEI24_03285 [Nitrospiria bacterium]|nr:hypothetical protein [Nitrospiria bacterium]